MENTSTHLNIRAEESKKVLEILAKLPDEKFKAAANYISGYADCYEQMSAEHKTEKSA